MLVEIERRSKLYFPNFVDSSMIKVLRKRGQIKKTVKKIRTKK
jgi:hypothetical protein